ncbi:hypothetical protein AVEN_189992-1 [Araneus ventricosus]|uniref:Uncharacterized protein n=1 Tax=Araneus ventricosus TaxID=182803 RepID=A0A4Y2WDK2_ARAVE|nr:hypothetical protein AVEN_189992-1 [Araneus ventricosus]
MFHFEATRELFWLEQSRKSNCGQMSIWTSVPISPVSPATPEGGLLTLDVGCYVTSDTFTADVQWNRVSNQIPSPPIAKLQRELLMLHVKIIQST